MEVEVEAEVEVEVEVEETELASAAGTATVARPTGKPIGQPASSASISTRPTVSEPSVVYES